jgi:RNA polymerase sigma-70 factor (ECF subfamily)
MTADQDNIDLAAAFDRHRPELLRHCYRMLGVFADAEELVQDVLLRAWQARATYAGDAPVLHWLMRIATNTCLTALQRRRPRELPQLDRPVATAWVPTDQMEAALWVTPAPDARLFPDPAQAAEAREDVAIAFIALLQRLPPRQRAVLLLKDVVGWPADEIAAALDLTVPSVNSALHRARETVATRPRGPLPDPSEQLLRDYLRCWEQRDLEALLALLKHDVVFAMPPHPIWFRGPDGVAHLLQTPRFAAFWQRGLRALFTRANGLPALFWYTPHEDGAWRPHSVHLMRFEDGRLAEATNFIGAHYLHGFDMPASLTSQERPTD